MELFFEILFDILIEGCAEIVKSKKVSILIRMLCGMVLGILFAGCIGILWHVAISNSSICLTIITIILAVFVLVGFIYKYLEYKKKH